MPWGGRLAQKGRRLSRQSHKQCFQSVGVESPELSRSSARSIPARAALQEPGHMSPGVQTASWPPASAGHAVELCSH